MQQRSAFRRLNISALQLEPSIAPCVDDMNSPVILLACLIATCLVGTVTAVLPSYIKPCSKSNPKFDQCITDTIEGLRGKLAEGISELEVPPTEPMKLETVRLLRGPTGARVDINLTSIVVNGPSTFEIQELKSNLNDNSFTFKLFFDRLTFKGKYQMAATLLLLRLTGEGDIAGNFTGFSSDVILRGKKVPKDGTEYLNFDKMKLDIKIGDAKVHLSNLFGGDPVLGPASNEILNANSALVIEELKPVLESSLADLFTDVANKVTTSFTYEELFPEK